MAVSYASRDAASYYQDFIIKYPNDPAVAKAEAGLDKARTQIAESKIVMADFYFYKRDNYVAAKVFYNEAITAYPDSEPAREAKAKLAQVEAKVSGKPVQVEPVKKKKHFLFF